MIIHSVLGILLATAIAAKPSTVIKHAYKDNYVVSLQGTDNGIIMALTEQSSSKQLLTGRLGIGQDFTDVSCIGDTTCEYGDIKLDVSTDDSIDAFRITWTTSDTSQIFRDCFDLNGDIQWYGGPQKALQTWPLQTMVLSEADAYVTRKFDNFAIAERYWLNSQGGYIYLTEKNPLFVSQNEESSQGQLCFISKLADPYINRIRNLLDYRVGFGENAKEAHLDAIQHYLGQPSGHPDTRMITEPIWTTWAEYKRDIDDARVLEFARNIRSHGYEKGQIEIDDLWETCYGAQEFSEKFGDIANTVAQLHEMGFRVTLWVHPFVNDDCQDNAQIGIENGYFVTSIDGLNNATWWNGDMTAHQIDFTNYDAAEWWSNRLRKLQNDPKIDNFKFDAGESNYAQQPSAYPRENQELIPNILSSEYIRTCAKFAVEGNNLIEVRSGFKTQDLPIFVRMLDKDTHWSLTNGLASLVTTLFQLNFNGYTMVLPDMIGGNGYVGEIPTPELFVRWTQANTFMPAMQFSYLPWEYTTDEYYLLSNITNKVDILELLKLSQYRVQVMAARMDFFCDCKPLCTDLSYEVQQSQSPWNFTPFISHSSEHFAKLNIFFKQDSFLTSERNELYGPTDFLANFGGLLGLFTGFSLLSAVEILYFLSVRLCCNFRLFRRWTGPQE